MESVCDYKPDVDLFFLFLIQNFYILTVHFIDGQVFFFVIFYVNDCWYLGMAKSIGM